MYLLSRSYAKYLIDTFTIDWAFNNKDKPYSPDWIITKNGNRALIWPPLGVEEGEVYTCHQGQLDFHKNCKEFLFNKEIYN